ncbi:hypothetical protein [Parasphingorhabdus sp.]|uniref:hypothetical protein n=1 Tax=Parasphingorhabdus sp. TaxID=2709688 RepID=UPI003A9253FD
MANGLIKSTAFLSLSLAMLSGCARGGVYLPYLGKYSAVDVCGGFSKNCLPTKSGKAAPLRDLIPYNQNPEEFIGRKFLLTKGYFGNSGIYDTQPCGTTVTANDILEDAAPRPFSVTVDDESKSKFLIKVDADVTEILDTAAGLSLPDQVKADIGAEVKENVDRSLDQSFDVSYKSVYAKNIPYIDAQIAPCRSTLGRNQYMITGLSIITVDGSWTKTRIVESFDSFETKAGFLSLSADIKASYKQMKDRVITGTVPEVSYITGMSYVGKPF